jgi:hypothetical protein
MDKAYVFDKMLIKKNKVNKDYDLIGNICIYRPPHINLTDPSKPKVEMNCGKPKTTPFGCDEHTKDILTFAINGSLTASQLAAIKIPCIIDYDGTYYSANGLRIVKYNTTIYQQEIIEGVLYNNILTESLYDGIYLTTCLLSHTPLDCIGVPKVLEKITKTTWNEWKKANPKKKSDSYDIVYFRNIGSMWFDVDILI